MKRRKRCHRSPCPHLLNFSLVTLSALSALSPCRLVAFSPCPLSPCPQMLTLSSWKSLSLAKESSRTQEEVVVATETWEPSFRGNLFQVTLNTELTGNQVSNFREFCLLAFLLCKTCLLLAILDQTSLETWRSCFHINGTSFLPCSMRVG